MDKSLNDLSVSERYDQRLELVKPKLEAFFLLVWISNCAWQTWHSDQLCAESERADDERSEGRPSRAAYLIGLTVDYWKDLNELKALMSESEIFQPNMTQIERMTKLKSWHNALKIVILFPVKSWLVFQSLLDNSWKYSRSSTRTYNYL